MMRSSRLAWFAAFALLAFSAAQAQQIQPLNPYVFPVAVTTSPAQAIGTNNTRKRIMFYNPNASVTVAVCPVYSRSTGAPLTCAVNGAGSISLLPYQSVTLDSVQPTNQIQTAWNAVGSGSGNLSVFEWE